MKKRSVVAIISISIGLILASGAVFALDTVTKQNKDILLLEAEVDTLRSELNSLSSSSSNQNSSSDLEMDSRFYDEVKMDRLKFGEKTRIRGFAILVSEIEEFEPQGKVFHENRSGTPQIESLNNLPCTVGDANFYGISITIENVSSKFLNFEELRADFDWFDYESDQSVYVVDGGHRVSYDSCRKSYQENTTLPKELKPGESTTFKKVYIARAGEPKPNHLIYSDCPLFRATIKLDGSCGYYLSWVD